VITLAEHFSARVYKLGINPCVDVPKEVSQAFAKRGYIPVRGALNGSPIRATLVPMGGGRHRLFLNGEMRKQANVSVGDLVSLVLEMDDQSRTVPMPPEFALALEKHEAAKVAFAQLSPSHQKEILAYLNWVKRPETLKRSIDKVIAKLEGRP
jgi:hypothetical protein